MGCTLPYLRPTEQGVGQHGTDTTESSVAADEKAHNSQPCFVLIPMDQSPEQKNEQYAGDQKNDSHEHVFSLLTNRGFCGY